MFTSTTVLAGLACVAGIAQAQYSLVDSYDQSNFFDEFSFYTGSDPTHGDVQFVDSSDGLAYYTNGQVYMGVDYTTFNPSAGRASTRVSSNKAYTHGLFIADIAHMPGSICGVWPAWWTFGPDWPSNGEIDIIEGVNQQATDSITLHTSAGCSVDTSGSLDGTVLIDADCNAGNANTGCGVSTSDSSGYGNGFNDVGGGVYAMNWDSDAISVYFFPRASIPADIAAGNPAPAGWGSPTATFGGAGCDIDQHFASHNIIFDTTFCGDWAGQVWATGSCASVAATCDDYVNGNPGAFASAYWLVNSVKVYQSTSATPTTPSNSTVPARFRA